MASLIVQIGKDLSIHEFRFLTESKRYRPHGLEFQHPTQVGHVLSLKDPNYRYAEGILAYVEDGKHCTQITRSVSDWITGTASALLRDYSAFMQHGNGYAMNEGIISNGIQRPIDEEKLIFISTANALIERMPVLEILASSEDSLKAKFYETAVMMIAATRDARVRIFRHKEQSLAFAQMEQFNTLYKKTLAEMEEVSKEAYVSAATSEKPLAK